MGVKNNRVACESFVQGENRGRTKKRPANQDYERGLRRKRGAAEGKSRDDSEGPFGVHRSEAFGGHTRRKEHL